MPQSACQRDRDIRFSKRSSMIVHTLARNVICLIIASGIAVKSVNAQEVDRVIAGKSLINVEKYTGEKSVGTFRKTATGKWLEESSIDGGQRKWTEQRAEGSSVFLIDGAAGMQLDLASGSVFYGDSNFQNRSRIYSLKNPISIANLTSVQKQNNGRQEGLVRQVNETTWHEEILNDAPKVWEERERAGGVVFLRHGEQTLQLDLHQRQIFHRFNDSDAFKFHCFIENPRSKVTGANATSVEKYTGDTLAGYFRQTGPGQWREESAVDSGKRDWTEQRRSVDIVYLRSLDGDLQLDLKENAIFDSANNFATRRQIYSIRNPGSKRVRALR